MNKIELTDSEATQFLAWRQHQDLFNKLLDLGVFGVSNGSAELHFDALGHLSNVKLHFTVFNKVIPTPHILTVKTTKVQ